MIETVRPSAIIEKNLNTLISNRETITRAVAQLPEERIWIRPSDEKWGIAEHLVHLNKTLNTMTTTMRILTPALYPFAWFNRERPYETTMQDWMNSAAYQPMKTAAVLEPKQARQSLEQISASFEKTMHQSRRFFLSLDERIAGNLILPYPPTKGKVSFLQLSFTLGYHEKHHFRAMAKLDESLRIAGISD